MSNVTDRIAFNLQEFLKNQNLSVNALCKGINVDQSNISRFIKRDNQDIKASVLIEICDKYSLPYDFFFKDNEIKESKTSQVLFFEIEAAAGSQSFFEEIYSTKIKLSNEIIEKIGYNADKLIAIKVKGDSMEPTFYDGDYIFTLKNYEHYENRTRCYVIWDKFHGFRVKRINWGKQASIIIISDNSIYDKEVYNQEEIQETELRLISPVVGSLSIKKLS